MQSRWDDKEARRAIEQWGHVHGEEVALRVYTSRLIGADPDLVLHGGGNTSVKATYRTILGSDETALFVKGSGSSLDSVEPADLPAVDLEGLRKLRSLASLSDEDMVNQLRIHLYQSQSPNPSVEALLHAFLPHCYIDHSHADAILSLTNQPGDEPAKRIRDCFGNRVAIVEWIMPGFPLAKAVAAAVEADPKVEGCVLVKHGLFSFGNDAQESYERHIALVDTAQQWLARRAGSQSFFTPRADMQASDAVTRERIAQVAPRLRGLLAESTEDPDRPWQRWIMDWRRSEEVLAFCNSSEAAGLAAQGPLTPDHVIRTKSYPLYIESPRYDDPEQLGLELAAAVAAYREGYDQIFKSNLSSSGVERTKLDSAPRVVLLPGLGALCFGKTAKDAAIAGDITEHTLAAKGLGNAVGQYQGLPDSDLFDMEYWSLEQAKLGKTAPRALDGQVVLITGGAGAIGVGIADVCAAAGAHVVLADLDGDRAQTAAAEIAGRRGRGSAAGLAMDVSDEASVQRAFKDVCGIHGGVDVVVPNAGIALVKRVEDLSAAEARRVSDVNYLGVLLTIREAARVFRLQGTGGNVVVNASKNVFAPGREFGAYSASKAAASQIAKVSAIELAELGVRVNLINADAIFAEGEVRSGLWDIVGPDRARSRGLDESALPDFYQQRNLLRARVSASHVGNAVVFFASNQTPTTGATLPVDGGLSEAFPR